MKHIKFIALIISILALLSSCSSKSTDKKVKFVKGSKMKVRAQRWNDKMNYTFANIEIIVVDTAHRVGDTIMFDAINEYERKYYIIQP